MAQNENFIELLERLARLGVADKTACEVLAIPTGSWSLARNGTRELRAQELLDVRNFVRDCETLQSRSVAALKWSDVRLLREALTALEHERSTPPKPLTAEESVLLQRFARGEPLDDLLSDTGMGAADFLKHVENLLGRTRRLTEIAAREKSEVRS